MTIKRFGFGREHTNMIGSPAIVGCADGEYVRHDDHAALISELQAELAGVERIVVAQTVTIAELRSNHSGGANDMVSAPVPLDPVAWRIDYTCPRNCGSVVYHGHNAIADYRDIDPNATSTPLFEQPPTSAQPVVSAESALNEDAIYLGCARMGLAEASDDEVLSFVRIAKQRAAAPTPPADGQAQQDAEKPACASPMSDKPACGAQNAECERQRDDPTMAGDDLDPVDKAWIQFQQGMAEFESDVDVIGNQCSDEIGNIPIDAWYDFARAILKHDRLRVQSASGEDA